MAIIDESCITKRKNRDKKMHQVPKGRCAIERAATRAIAEGRDLQKIFDEAKAILEEHGGAERNKKAIKKWRKALRLK